MAVLMEGLNPTPDKTNKVVDKKKYFLNHQIKFAKDLAANDEGTRKRTLKKLEKWFEKRSEILPFTEGDFQIIWKGLFYCMWMADKALVQEEFADKIAKLIHLPTIGASHLFFQAGLQILINEWFGIDQLRLDKFLMLVRRLLREMLAVLRNNEFKRVHIIRFTDVLSETILSTTVKQPVGLFMHFIEIFLEELAKVSRGKIHNDRLVDILRPFIANMVSSNDGRHLGYLRKYIFTYLIRQSDLGQEYQAKYEAWKAQGFPGSIDSMQKIILDDDERMSSEEDEVETSENKKGNVLDPRAGRVNVELPQIKFNPKSIAAVLSESKFDKNSTTRSRKIIKVLIEQFTKLASGEYPLGIKKIHSKNIGGTDTNVRKAANRLIKFEQKLLGKNRKRKHNNEDDDEEIVRKKTKITKKNKSSDEADYPTKISKDKINKASKNLESVKKSKKIKKSKRYSVPDNIECILERNSGTWVVYEVDKEVIQKKSASPQSSFQDSSAQEVEVPSSNSENSNIDVEACQDSSDAKKVQVPEDKRKKSGWDEPLQEGEYDMIIPAKKYLIKKLNKTLNKTTPLNSIKGKSRVSLDPSLLRNPFASTPNSMKKVKINMKLNKSQEVHEHQAQILSSPGIPYDASKKPSKPLLKCRTPSRLNPFYKK